MSAPVAARSSRTVPPRNAVVDRTHPLASSLEFCYVPAISRNDLARGYAGVVSGSPAVGSTAFGASGAIRSATSDYVEFACPDAPFLNAISFTVVFRNLSASSFRCVLSKVSSNGGTNNPFDIYLQNTASPQAVRFIRGDTGNCAWQGTNAITVNTDYVWSLSSTAYNPASVLTCTNGVIETVARVQNQATKTSATGAGKPIRVGRRDDGATQADEFLTMAAIWSRAISTDEMQRLYADPFCFLRW